MNFSELAQSSFSRPVLYFSRYREPKEKREYKAEIGKQKSKNGLSWEGAEKVIFNIGRLRSRSNSSKRNIEKQHDTLPE